MDLGGARDVPIPGPKFLYFHAVFGKTWSNSGLPPDPSGMVSHPLGNLASATALSQIVDGLVNSFEVTSQTTGLVIY